MATQDSVPITTLERAVSTDVVTAQDLINRSLAEWVKCFARSTEVDDAGPYTFTREHIASGLFVTVSGGTMFMETGLLAQQVSANPPDVPAPGTFDSSYRFGIQFSPASLSDPHNSLDRYWLLQARVVRETTLSEQRDIFNPTTELFTLSPSNLDKRYESQIETDWVEGTATTIPSPDTGWAPIAAVWRPSAGGTITDADIIQLSMQFNDLSVERTDHNIVPRKQKRLRCGAGIGDPSPDCEFSFSAIIGGVKHFARTSAPVSLRSSVFIDPSDIGSIGTDGLWWYVYLCKYTDHMPSTMYTDVEHRGAIVVSRTPPNDYGSNSSTITIPNPVNEAVAGSAAAFVGCFLASGTGSEIGYQDIAENGDGVIEFLNNIVPTLTNSDGYHDGITYDLSTSGVSGTERVPYGCHLKMYIRHDDLDVSSTALAVEITFSMGGDLTSYLYYPRVLLGCRNIVAREFELYPKDGNLNLTCTTRTLTAALGTTPSTPNDGGTNEFALGCYGIRLI